MRRVQAAAVGAVLSIFCSLVLLTAAYARADQAAEKSFDIAPQSLAGALSEFARQSEQEILFAPQVAASKLSGGVRGTMPPLTALKVLLKDSALDFTTTPSGAILIGAAARGPATASTAAATENTGTSGEHEKGAQKAASFWDRFRLAQVDQGSSVSDTAGGAAQRSDAPVKLEEVVVTAQKREERLQNVPVPVTAIQAESLVNGHQLRLQDYYTRVPGLSVIAGSSASSAQTLSIRGITAGPSANPTVGITVDDVPYGSSTGLGGGNVVADFDPGDLSRIEVLRGPQGTLYGASSMGGLLKFVTTPPSTEAFAGRLEAGTLAIKNGDGVGYTVRGSGNIPVSDTFAVRASGFTRRDPGYIDNPVLGIDGINEQRTHGGRLAALWAPTADFSLTLSALYQKFAADGVNDVTAGMGDLEQNYLPGIGPSDGEVQAYSATLAGKVGDVTVTALSGYNVRKAHSSLDESSVAFFSGATQSAYGVSGVSLTTDNDIKKFSQEIRLAGPIGARADWLLGAFYTHEKTSPDQALFAIDANSGTVLAKSFDTFFPSTYREYAGFGDLTLHLSSRFDLQIGARQSSIEQTNLEQVTLAPLFGATAPSFSDPTRSSAHPFTYLLTPSFKVSPDLMLYARAASGYRAGGPNGQLCVQNNLPCDFKPDETRNYEIGVKGSLFDKRLSFDASVYYIDWQDIQVYVSSAIGYNTNAGSAKSEGIELSLEAQPASGLTVASWITVSNAELTEDFPAGALYGVSGSRLPYSSRFSGNLSIEQRFPLGNMVGLVGGSVSYVGDRLGGFSGAASAPRQQFPGYARTDLQAALMFDSWTASVFANNIFDRRGVLEGGLDFFPTTAFIYIQPRTIGLNVAKSF